MRNAGLGGNDVSLREIVESDRRRTDFRVLLYLIVMAVIGILGTIFGPVIP